MSGENDSKRPDDLNDATRQPVSQDPPSPDDAQLQAEAEAYAKSDADYAFFTEEAQHEDGAIARPRWRRLCSRLKAGPILRVRQSFRPSMVANVAILAPPR